jgi:hypothetical protein
MALTASSWLRDTLIAWFLGAGAAMRPAEILKLVVASMNKFLAAFLS